MISVSPYTKIEEPIQNATKAKKYWHVAVEVECLASI
jgi:hypothetical protein